jgi:cyclase
MVSSLVAAYGSQAIVVSIEAKRTKTGWEAYTDNGREKTGKDAIEWAHEAVERGAGEILLTSIDQEGTRRGFDLGLLRALGRVSVPVVIGGGCGSARHIVEALEAGADAVAIADILHYGRTTIGQLKREIQQMLPDRTDIRHVA